jgi:hypothetical protein
MGLTDPVTCQITFKNNYNLPYLSHCAKFFFFITKKVSILMSAAGRLFS